MQTCRTCGLTKPLTDFHSSKANRSGYSYECKSCANVKRETRRQADLEGQSVYWAKHYQKNKEKKKAQASKYYYENQETCRERQAAWYINNKDVHAQNGKTWRAENADHVREHNRLKRLANLEDMRAKRRQHYADNKHMYIANSAKRRADTIQATPLWADFEAIKEIYRQSDELTQTTGVAHCVDHIIPIHHGLVCGLHVETNLQILTAAENTAKSNRFEPGPMDCQSQDVCEPKQKSFSFAA